MLDAWVGCAKALEQVVEGTAFDAAELLFEVVGLQEIPSPAAGAHDTQWNLLRCELGMELVKHTRASQIQQGRCREVAHDELEVVDLFRLDSFEDSLQDRIRIHVDQVAFRAERDGMTQRFIFRMKVDVRVITGARNTSQKATCGREARINSMMMDARAASKIPAGCRAAGQQPAQWWPHRNRPG